MPLKFSFPPESYSAIYNGDGTTCSANANCKSCEAWEGPTSPPTSPEVDHSLFSCFHCAFRTNIRVIPKEKHKKKQAYVLNKGSFVTCLWNELWISGFEIIRRGRRATVSDRGDRPTAGDPHRELSNVSPSYRRSLPLFWFRSMSA